MGAILPTHVMGVGALTDADFPPDQYRGRRARCCVWDAFTRPSPPVTRASGSAASPRGPRRSSAQTHTLPGAAASARSPPGIPFRVAPGRNAAKETAALFLMPDALSEATALNLREGGGDDQKQL